MAEPAERDTRSAMNDQTTLSDRLALAFRTPAAGVVGLVEELLAATLEQDVRLSWHAGCCRIFVPRADPPEQSEVPVPKSVLRAVLARVAVLCNERIPDSVSPYRGIGEVAVDPTHVVRVQFVNTPDEQSLELSSVRRGDVRPAGAQLSPPIAEKSGPPPQDNGVNHGRRRVHPDYHKNREAE